MKLLRNPALFAAVVCALAISAAQAAPYSFEAAPGRLPKNVVPLDYTVAITPDVPSLSIRGQESVLLEFRAATKTIQFNSLNETLSGVRLDGKPVAKVVSDNDAQLTTVTLASAAPVGRHTLTFDYKAKIEKQPQGLFAQDYRDRAGADHVLLSTQMEATDARRMFPCWDEPAFRATFALTATVRADWKTVSNMPIAHREVNGALATTTFARTPKMPSYLVEFTAGDIASISGEGDGIAMSVWAPRGREEEGRQALANSAQILTDYNEYFGYRFPLPKLDSIAIPGGFQGAMENWGAITYNDQTLLLSSSSTTGDLQEVFSIQAHEMAHQWFGDLVTMAWWNEIWLNESFASWMAAKETALRHPDWKWWEGEDASKEAAMRADARITSHAIEREVKDELQASNSFDPEITYNKGEAVLRMFEGYLGADVFRAGVRAYMKSQAFSNATGTDLWNALGKASGKDMTALAATWTTQPGFPLVAVAATCAASGARTISLAQKRFLLGGGDPGTLHWSVPLQVRVGAQGSAQTVLLTSDGQTVAAGRCDEPLSINADAVGYYRSSYDAATLATNTRRFGELKDGDRIALLDDQWALAGSGAAPLTSYLALASSMGTDLDTRAWEQIAHSLEKIEFAERGTPGHDAFAGFARSVLKPPFERLGWDPQPGETPDVRRLRRVLIGDLGEWGDPDVNAEARRRFVAFVKDRHAIATDEQGVILSVVARGADKATFDQLHELAKSATDSTEIDRYYGALVEVGDPALAAEAAQIALSAEIPPQEDANRLRLVAGLAREHPDVSWQTFTAHSDQLLAPAATFAPLLIAQTVPQIYWHHVPFAEVEAWVRAHAPAQMGAEVERGLEAAHYSQAERDRLVPQADAYLHR